MSAETTSYFTLVRERGLDNAAKLTLNTVVTTILFEQVYFNYIASKQI
jgi:hypothetical protein